MKMKFFYSKVNMFFFIFLVALKIGCGSEDNSSDAVTDSEAPQLTIMSPSDNTTWGSGLLTVQGTASDDVAIDRVEYKIDAGDYQAALGTTSWEFQVDTGLLADASHVVTVKVTDTSDKTHDVSISINIDHTAPLAEMSGTPASLTNTTSISVTVGGTDVVAYRYRVDSPSWSDEVPAGTPITKSGLCDGTHRVYVVGRDAYGNWQQFGSASQYLWTVDTTAAAARITGIAHPLKKYTSTDFALDITIGGTDVVAYKFTRDSTVWSDEFPVATHITASSLLAGSHTVRVIAKDSAGNWQNVSSPTNFTWVILNSTPTSDNDSDGVADINDNCPYTSNVTQQDSDGDGVGNVCDNCVNTSNASQIDGDNDGRGDSCDNCVNTSNASQADADNDGVGDVCDNCTNRANNAQSDADRDGRGDACDNCINVPNTQNQDADADGAGDTCDNCPGTSNSNQADSDQDGTGDVCE